MSSVSRVIAVFSLVASQAHSQTRELEQTASVAFKQQSQSVLGVRGSYLPDNCDSIPPQEPVCEQMAAATVQLGESREFLSRACLGSWTVHDNSVLKSGFYFTLRPELDNSMVVMVVVHDFARYGRPPV